MNVATRDGRTLVVHEAGDRDGFPVVVHHGTPSTGELYERWTTPGIRLIGFDRAGYGGSTRRHGRRIADVAADVQAIVDALELERFATWGISGGGPHALACAALLGDRLVAAAAVGSPAPFDADGLDWLAGQGEGNVAEHTAALDGEETLRPMLEREHAAMAAGGADGIREGMATLLSEADAAILDGGLVDYLHHLIAATGGVDGWIDDDLAFVAPWGFELAAIGVPVLVRHGEQDRFVPPGHARWLAERIPGAEVRITSEDGHLTLYEHGVADVHDWVLRNVH